MSPPSPEVASRAFLATLVLFLASGALGLGYQVLWSKYLLDFVGASAYSYSTVLAAFMGGLGIGSALLGRMADRTESPLRLYAYLEVGIGLYALLYERASGFVAQLYAGWVSISPEQAGGSHGLWAKALAAALLLLVPTTLMGGTYPAMLRHATERVGLVGRRASQLYAANAAGAVLGALLMAFLLMPALGMRRSLMVLALCNALVAAAALLLARRCPPPSAAAPAAGEPREIAASALAHHPAPPRPRLARVALLLIFVEGLLAFALEVAWTRYFGVVLGSSTYSFAIMLAAFISGIALGSAWLSHIEGAIREPLRFFGWTQILAGIAVLVPLPFYPYVPWLFLNYGLLFSTHPLSFFLSEAGKLLFCCAIMLPATVLIGMALPLVVKELGRNLGGLGEASGRIYAWNTWGNVVGALLAGLLLLPALGMERLLRGAAFGSVSLGLAAVWIGSPSGFPKRPMLLAGAALLAASSLSLRPWPTEWFAISGSRRAQGPLPLRETRIALGRHRVLLFEDDPAAHLMVYATGPAGAAGEEVRLAVNGKVDATSDADMPTQILSAHVPLLLAPSPQDVLVVGLASGVTSGAALKHPLRRLDVVDIVGSMPKATRLFRAWNDDPFSDPRFRLIADDARSYLSHTSERYDVIISEPSNPWTAGTGALFSRDFYAKATAALTPDGIYLQWLQAYEMSDETFAAVVRTFHGTFPYVYAFQGLASDVLLLGSRRALRPDWSDVASRFARPAVREHLAGLGIADLPTLLAFQRLSPPTVAYIASLTDLENSDDNHLLEYRAPRDLFRVAGVSLVPLLDERLHSGPALLWSDFLRHHRGEVDSLATLRALSDGRVRVEPVVAAYQLAAYHLDEKVAASPEAAPLFPELSRFNPPPTAPVFAETVSRIVAAGRWDLAASLVESNASAILLESALSGEKAAFWSRKSREWLAHPLAASPPKLRAFRVELLMASGQVGAAARELAEWLREAPGPPAEWAVRRACEMDPEAFCTTVVLDYAGRSAAPFLRRLLALRQHREGDPVRGVP